MRLFRRAIRHPFYPRLKLAPAARAQDRCPALTGTFEELSEAAAAGRRAARAVFPLQHATTPFPTDEQRDALWAMFHVPVLAILLDGRDGVIGYECEVQEGFHLAEGFTDGLLFGTLDCTICECGRPGPRLLPAAAEVAAHKHERGPAA
jgi:hypothetical protein